MDLEKILKALGEPTRLKIYQNLLERKHCVRSLSKKLNITESAVSQHIKIMREAGLVYGEKFGLHTHYLPSQQAVEYICDSFTQMKQLSENLDREVSICHCEFKKEIEIK